MLFRIHHVEAWDRSQNQIIVFLEDADGNTESPTGSSYVVRLTLPEAPTVMADLLAAYSGLMQNVAIELASGGCKTCHNSRQVNGERCPVCSPRADRRLRDKVFPDYRRRSADG